MKFPKSKLGCLDSAVISLRSALRWLRVPAFPWSNQTIALPNSSMTVDSLGGLTWFFTSSLTIVLQLFRFPPGALFQLSPLANSNAASGMSDGFMLRTWPSHFIRRFIMVKWIRSHFATDYTNSLGRSCLLLRHLHRQRISNDCKHLRPHSFIGQLSHPYKSTLLTHALYNLTLIDWGMFLWFQIFFRLLKLPTAFPILELTSDVTLPPNLILLPRYVNSFNPF